MADQANQAAAVLSQNLHQRCINTIRTLSVDSLQATNSGHHGTPMTLAPAAYCLWQRELALRRPGKPPLTKGKTVVITLNDDAYQRAQF